MTMQIPGSITGGAQTGFTTPGYTATADKAPDVNANQSAILAITGTQTGVRVHSVSDPFTVYVGKPKNIRVLPSPNPVTGKYGPVPTNRYSVVVRKGTNFAANNAPAISYFRGYIDVVAGADAFDPANVRAMLSAAIGLLSSISAGTGDTATSGVL